VDASRPPQGLVERQIVLSVGGSGDICLVGSQASDKWAGYISGGCGARLVKPGHAALNYLTVSGAKSLTSLQPPTLHSPQKPLLVVLLRNACDHLFRRKHR